jgi:hypothetical protein
MKFNLTQFLFLTLLFPLCFACTGEATSEKITNTQMVGTWECIEGSLNGESNAPFAKTETTPGAVIKFSETVMEFDLLESDLGKSKSQPFKLEGTKISFTNDTELTMNIKKMEEKTMTLEFKIGEYNLEMIMERK